MTLIFPDYLVHVIPMTQRFQNKFVQIFAQIEYQEIHHYQEKQRQSIKPERDN